MHRVRIAPGAQTGALIILPESEAHYVARVLRLRVGDTIVAFDGAGQEWRLQLTCVSPAEVQGRVLTTRETMTFPQALVLGQALPKSGKMDLIVEKCSELGLTTLVPLYTECTVIRDVPGRLGTKLARWRRVAEAAARQCGRHTLLEVQGPRSLEEFCAYYSTAAAKIVCWEGEQKHGARQVLEALTEHGPVVVVVGPEAGLTEQEVALARTYGFVTMSLGPRRLRTETAAVVVTSLVRYRLGELDPQGGRG